MALLVLEGISKTYRQGSSEINVLNNINFELKKGEVAALVAPSGSGKTTLLQLVGLIDQPTSGEISLDGMKCSRLDDKKITSLRKKKIGFIFQLHHLMPEFTALENVMMPLLIAGIDKNEASQKAQGILKKMGLAERMGNLPAELSGGEQQRVAVARALIHDPVLLLADEPTGNLDHKNALQIITLMLNEVRERSLAIIIVTHNAEIAKMADLIFTIEDGRIKKL